VMAKGHNDQMSFMHRANYIQVIPYTLISSGVYVYNLWF